ncbi:MAG: metallopeptidase TldD-related protein [Deltaproteobacteria bacterium]|nr:metallopeptidase TldD-related protein [Deltaproteobacteria bacterium]
MTTSTLERAQQALQKDARFSAWQVSHVRGRSTQRYDVFGVPEARRVVETETTEVRVHVPHDGGTHIGESSFVVDATASIGPQLDAAFSRARLVKNKRWTLPGPQAASEVDASDPRIIEAAGEACDEIMKGIGSALSSSSSSSSIQCCAAEAFCDFRRVHLVNSLGLERTREDTAAYVEYVLLARALSGSSGETETYQQTRARRLDQLGLVERVDGDARAASLAQTATVPDSGVVDVVLSEQGIDEIFDAFVAHASGGAAWEGWSKLSAGNPIVDELSGDALSITSDPTIAGGLSSFAFDELGLSGRKVDVVVDGVFMARPLDQKHACWLEQPATSSWGNVVIGSGSSSEATLLKKGERPLLHLTRFSQLSPHPTTGAFSGEIRLGAVVDVDGSRRPIRGGSITGDVFDAFRRARFSSERVVRGRLHAPRSLRLDAVAITGG